LNSDNQKLPDNQLPVFSIITPTYRRPVLLVRNIRSVISQTYANYEHIIVDDSNDPETERVVKEFDDNRIVFLKHSNQKGAAAAYNTGIKASKGEFITFLDDDDEYLPQYLEKMHHKFSSSDRDCFVWTGISRVRDIKEGERLIANVTWPPVFNKKEDSLIASTSIGNGFGVCIRKRWIESVGPYDENLKYGSDTDFMMRLAQKYPCQTIPEILVKIHKHDNDQLTDRSNYEERVKVFELLLNRYKDFLIQYPKLFCVQYSSFAAICYKSGKIKSGREALLRIIRKKPARIRTYCDYFTLEMTGKPASQTFIGLWIKRLAS
jgi:glycosyltransferase involved in cell wall biosynthesis